MIAAHSGGEYCRWGECEGRSSRLSHWLLGQGAYRVRMGLSASEPASEGVAPPPLAADMRRRERVAGCCCGGDSPVSTTSP